jgi:iron(III) transport system substrate-binding protein
MNESRILRIGRRQKLTAVVAATVLLLTGVACGSRTDNSASNAQSANSQTMSMQDLYTQAKTEGTVVVYGGGSIIPKITPVFEKAFPGIKVENVDATADSLVARAVSESRGGKTLGDVWQSPLDSLVEMNNARLLLPLNVPEGKDYPDDLKGDFWLASDQQYLTIAWNNSLIPAGAQPPRTFEELADPKWKGLLVAEPRDFQILQALATHKYKSDEKAADLMRRIAENAVKFHKGHNELDQLLAGGQSAICWTCYSNHIPPLEQKGAPLGFSLEEGVGQPNGSAVFSGARHPAAAILLVRWIASQEGQQAYAESGRIPALSSVQPTDPTRVKTSYTLTPEDIANSKKYSDQWNEIFDLQ